MKPGTNPITKWVIIGLLILAGIGLIAWGNYRYCSNNSGGADFLVDWMGTRLFLQEGLNPYSEEAARETQEIYYGRPARSDEKELRVSFPLYSIVVYLPFALINDFVLARAIWMTVLEIALIILIYVSIRLMDWKPRFPTLILFVFFSLFWFHTVEPLRNGSEVILVALIVAGGILALRHRADEFAGVLFTFSMISPQIVLVLVLYLVIWAIEQRRWKFVSWFFGTLAILSASIALLQPNWIIEYFLGLLRYSVYPEPNTFGSALAVMIPAMGKRIGLVVSGIMIAILLVEWFLQRKIEVRGFIWTAYLTIVVSMWIGVETRPENFILALPALALVFSSWEERWGRFGPVLSIASMVILGLGIWLISRNGGEAGVIVPQLFFPLPAYLLITLYWVRWWAIRPPSVWFDLINQQENVLQ